MASGDVMVSKIPRPAAARKGKAAQGVASQSAYGLVASNASGCCRNQLVTRSSWSISVAVRAARAGGGHGGVPLDRRGEGEPLDGRAGQRRLGEHEAPADQVDAVVPVAGASRTT